ncbi:hypothetical protein QQ056_15020 [Oscillatoria laete-virens NRMC-F 0139]|nr:hypothetical protein [Oscillatoria laete-virens]MDL5054849.1 hypothetical protein [Oscillatoria laete-virens NRMC-F 0139]
MTTRIRFSTVWAKPRIWAGAIVLIGSFWFFIASPKTPVEFFDAGHRDNPQPAHLTELSSIRYDMERIALIHDTENNPDEVQNQRAFILLGFYDAPQKTREILTQTNPVYRDLLERWNRVRREMKETQNLRAPDDSEKDHSKEAMRYMEKNTLRQFQAKIFWRVRS